MLLGYILRISPGSDTSGEHAVVAWERPKAVGIRLNSSNGTLNPIHKREMLDPKPQPSPLSLKRSKFRFAAGFLS